VTRLVRAGLAGALLAWAGLLSPARAAAQLAASTDATRAAPSGRALTFAAAVGFTPSLPSSGWEDRRGYGGLHLQLAAERSGVLGPLALRLDAAAHRLSRDPLGAPLGAHATVLGATAGVALPLARAAWRLQPYALAGVGAYRTEYGNGQDWHFGLTAGGGVRTSLGRVQPMVEWRVHDVRDGSTPRLAPVSLGLRF